MGLRAIVVGGLPLLLAIPLAAEDSLISRGFEHFYNLEFDQAMADFSAATRQQPDDPNAWNHLAQATLYRAMYRSGALESQFVNGTNTFLRREKVTPTPDEDKTFSEAIDKALDISQTRLHQDDNNAAALYSQGIAYGLRANYNFSVRKAWVDALRDASSARKAHARACLLDPGNADARLIPALFDYVTGSLPLGYRILGFLGGYRGDRQRGIRTLETVAREGKSNRVDAQVLLAVIYRRERRAQEAIPLLENLIREFPRSYLLSFEIVQMYGDLGDKQAALDQLQRIRRLHRQAAPGFAQLPLEKIDRLEGSVLGTTSRMLPSKTQPGRAVPHASLAVCNTGTPEGAEKRVGQRQNTGKNACATTKSQLFAGPVAQAFLPVSDFFSIFMPACVGLLPTLPHPETN